MTTKGARRGVVATVGIVMLAQCAAAYAQAAASAPGASGGAPSLFTAAQAERGEGNYEHYCRACHGEHLDDGDLGGPPLRGSYFRGHWGAGDVAALFAYTKSQMPPDNPGELNDATYADILAYVLQYNGYKAGPDALPTDPAAQAKLKLATSAP
jgi:cytochrome c